MRTPYYQDDLVTLYHGDCREITEWLEADVMVTDPPYGETSLTWDRWPDGWPTLAASGSARSMWCFGSMRMFLDRHDEFADWRFSHEVVWRKNAGTGFQSDRFKRVHEFATHWYRGDWASIYKQPPLVATGNRSSGRAIKRGPTEHYGKQGQKGWIDEGVRIMHSVIEVRNMHGSAEHPTQKPVGIITPLIQFATPPGGIVADPFAGSGSTLVAAKMLGRKAIGVEIEERYCEIAARRLLQDALPFEVGA